MTTKDVNTTDIQRVAMYVRKSRGDEDKDLDNHIRLLTDIAKNYNWEFEPFHEVGSGSSIEDRPEMMRLLDEVDRNQFDAVLVFDQDRLTRGGGADQEKLMWHLRNSGTKVVTGAPFSIFDPQNEADVDMLNMKSFFGNYEYRMISKRFKHGKKMGASKGHWVYGTPPYGYQYDKETKKLKVHPEEGEIVLRIIREFVHLNKSTGEIAWELNKDGYQTRKGSVWNNKAIRAILIRDTYLGNTTYNKTEGTPTNRSKSKYNVKTPFRRLPKSEWKTVYNTHEALMTEEEKEFIDKRFSSNRKPKKGKEGDVFDLSGLCRTPDGRGYTRSGKLVSNGAALLVPMTAYDEEGRNLPEEYKMVDSSLVRDAIKTSARAMETRLEKVLKDNDNEAELEAYRKKLETLESKHDNILAAFDRIMEGFTAGLYDINKAQDLKVKYEKDQGEIETEIREVRRKIDSFSNVKNEDRITRLRRFQKDIEEAKKGRELNRLYKTIIRDIEVSRTEDREVEITVNFL